MRIHVAHTLGRQGARHKLSRFADGVSTREWPGGVDVRDITSNWTGDRLDFSFAASRGFFSLTIRGWLDVADAEVILDAGVPPMLATLVGEDRIREVLTTELERVLGE